MEISPECVTFLTPVFRLTPFDLQQPNLVRYYFFSSRHARNLLAAGPRGQDFVGRLLSKPKYYDRTTRFCVRYPNSGQECNFYRVHHPSQPQGTGTPLVHKWSPHMTHSQQIWQSGITGMGYFCGSTAKPNHWWNCSAVVGEMRSPGCLSSLLSCFGHLLIQKIIVMIMTKTTTMINATIFFQQTDVNGGLTTRRRTGCTSTVACHAMICSTSRLLATRRFRANISSDQAQPNFSWPPTWWASLWQAALGWPLPWWLCPRDDCRAERLLSGLGDADDRTAVTQRLTASTTLPATPHLHRRSCDWVVAIAPVLLCCG